MGIEAKQYLQRSDIREELQIFAQKQAVDHANLALSELRKSNPSFNVAVGHAVAADVYDQLLAQLQLYLKEDV